MRAERKRCPEPCPELGSYDLPKPELTGPNRPKPGQPGLLGDHGKEGVDGSSPSEGSGGSHLLEGDLGSGAAAVGRAEVGVETLETSSSPRISPHCATVRFDVLMIEQRS